jgi:preprotein translocase subunit SecE
MKESLKEINSITWPSNKETLQTTLVISGLVILMGTILCLIDVIFFNFIKWVANFG